MRRSLARLFLPALIFVPMAFPYVRQFTNDASPSPLLRPDSAAIQFSVNSGVAPGAQSNGRAVITADSDPVAAIRASLAAWNAIGSANIRFLPLKSTSQPLDGSDGQMTIGIGSTPDELSVLGSRLAITSVHWTPTDAKLINGQLFACTTDCNVFKGNILDSDILLNPATTFSTTGADKTVDLQSVITHELGHSLGADHSGLAGATMYPFTFNNFQRYPGSDDIAFARSSYPSVPPAPTGTIGGTVTTTAGAPVPFALLSMVDTSTGASLGALAAADGTWSVQVPEGHYTVYAEPFSSFVQSGNFASTGGQASFTQFQSTLFGGNVAPASLPVTAGTTATANITVPTGATPLPVPFYGIGAPGGKGDVKTFPSLSAPVLLTTGRSIDLVLIGQGYDATLTPANVRVYGQGVTVRAIAIDPLVTANGNLPLVRVTLDLAARQTTTLASIFIVKGANTLSLSGVLVLTPPAPVFTSKSVVSAASGAGNGAGDGAVSPGEYATIYGAGLAPTGGPVFGGYLNGGYDGNGYLPALLSGVSVSFDGVAAPIFFVLGGPTGQINLQVPFEVAGRASTQIVVSFLGSPSSVIQVPVLPVHPAFFTIGTAAYTANQNGSLNTAANPEARGNSIVVYGTGVGKPAYAIQTGTGATAPPSFGPNGYTCTIGGVNAPVAFAGWTPTAVALAQWNLQISPSLTATGAVPVVCSAGGQSTQSGLTVFVK